MPQGIKQAIIAIWVTITLTVVAELIKRWSGQTSVGEFSFAIIFYALFCIFPYKLAKGSNPARWIYAILVVVLWLFMLGGLAAGLSRIDVVVSIVSLPLDIFIVYRLFQPSASDWFSTKQA